MDADASNPRIAADIVGVHFLHGERDIVVDWGEIAQVSAVRQEYADGRRFIEVFVDHISGVDFRFLSIDKGFEQTVATMERYLIGFMRSALEAVPMLDEENQTIPVVWKRDESIQPFQLCPPVIDPRGPTPEERVQMEAAYHASIATCERALGRPLEAGEIECVQTSFENGRIVGRIAPPLCDLLLNRRGPAL
jgi:hypothetical protein